MFSQTVLSRGGVERRASQIEWHKNGYVAGAPALRSGARAPATPAPPFAFATPSLFSAGLVIIASIGDGGAPVAHIANRMQAPASAPGRMKRVVAVSPTALLTAPLVEGTYERHSSQLAARVSQRCLSRKRVVTRKRYETDSFRNRGLTLWV